MALDPIFPGHEDLYEPSKIYLFGKPFKGLQYVRNDLARSKYNSPPAGQRIDMPPGLTEETLIRDRFGNFVENSENQHQNQSKKQSLSLKRMAKVM